MTTTTASSASPAVRRVRDGYWRVTAASGRVAGYVEALDTGGERPRYRAKRLVPGTVRVVEVGDFWRFEEAAECVR
jgi:hypothetical protein